MEVWGKAKGEKGRRVSEKVFEVGRKKEWVGDRIIEKKEGACLGIEV